jgi:hypothetical protein
MADCMAAEIWIGGPVPASLVPELCAAISEQSVALEWGEPIFEPGSGDDLMAVRRERDGTLLLWLCDNEARWGEFDSLELFLREHNIPFTRKSDGGYEYDPEMIEFRPGREAEQVLTDKWGELVVAVSLLNELKAGLDAIESAPTRTEMIEQIQAVRRLVEKRLPPMLPPLETFEIVADGEAGNASGHVVQQSTGADETASPEASLVEFAEQNGLQAEQLDEIVHDCASMTASEINNAGMERQIDFLVENLGAVETRQRLADIAGEKGNEPEKQ